MGRSSAASLDGIAKRPLRKRPYNGTEIAFTRDEWRFNGWELWGVG